MLEQQKWIISDTQMEARWEFTAPQFVDFAAIDLDDLEEDKFFDVNNETRWCSILVRFAGV